MHARVHLGLRGSLRGYWREWAFHILLVLRIEFLSIILTELSVLQKLLALIESARLDIKLPRRRNYRGGLSAVR
jgi:hypothetical protein